jgi:hypothetical protein
VRPVPRYVLNWTRTQRYEAIVDADDLRGALDMHNDPDVHADAKVIYDHDSGPQVAEIEEPAQDPFGLPSLPTVGYCSKCGEARSSVYTCRDGGETVATMARKETPDGDR